MRYNKIEQIVISLLPDISMRKRYLDAFAQSIVEANKYGANKWGVYVDNPSNDKVRLLVGNLIVLTIHKRGLWIALDRQSLEESQDKRNYLESSPEWHWDIGLYSDSYPEYKRVPSINGDYAPLGELHLWPHLREFHFKFLRRVAEKYSKLNIRSQAKHMPDLLTYLRHELNQYVPAPKYEDEFLRLPEELLESDALFEGSKQTIMVNAYERNPKARQACIDYYGTTCFVCGFDFVATYGEVGRDFIHVHHLKRLADIGEEYKVDPISDLRPVCPNCHAIIHKGNPPFPIDKVKRFLLDAQPPS